jgi:hypothetical protein
MAYQVARMETKDGREIVVVAVRQDVFKDEARRAAVLDVMSGLFPNEYVVLAASTSDGLKFTSAGMPEIEETVRRKRSAFKWSKLSPALV